MSTLISSTTSGQSNINTSTTPTAAENTDASGVPTGLFDALLAQLIPTVQPQLQQMFSAPLEAPATVTPLTAAAVPTELPTTGGNVLPLPLAADANLLKPFATQPSVPQSELLVSPDVLNQSKIASPFAGPLATTIKAQEAALAEVSEGTVSITTEQQSTTATTTPTTTTTAAAVTPQVVLPEAQRQLILQTAPLSAQQLSAKAETLEKSEATEETSTVASPVLNTTSFAVEKNASTNTFDDNSQSSKDDTDPERGELFEQVLANQQVQPQDITDAALPVTHNTVNSIEAPAAAAAPANVANLSEQLKLQASAEAQAIDGIEQAHASSSKQITIKLNPIELGQMEIKISKGEMTESGHQSLVASLVVSTPEARELLEKRIDALSKSLNDKGIQLGRVEIIERPVEATAAQNNNNQSNYQQQQQSLLGQFQQSQQQFYQPQQQSFGNSWNKASNASSTEYVADTEVGSVSEVVSKNDNGSINIQA